MDLGWCISIFSIGRLVVGRRLGLMADIYRHRFTLIVDNIIMIVGAMLWANCLVLGGLPTLYLAQFILGVGTGSLGVTRSYVVEQTTPKNRFFNLILFFIG